MLFNNCRCRPHAELFGATAFYDLLTTGKQAGMALGLEPGQHCCVATPIEDEKVEFGWFRFSHEQRLRDPDEPATVVRVFFGEWLGSETLPRAKAIATEPYAQFFNVNGHFKRPSAIRPRGEFAAPRGLQHG